MHLGLGEFIRRLRLHFLPPRFVKIRHYGLLANRGRPARLEQARALLQLQSPDRPTAARAPAPTPRSTLPICPHCGWAALVPGAGRAAAARSGSAARPGRIPHERARVPPPAQ